MQFVQFMQLHLHYKNTWSCNSLMQLKHHIVNQVAKHPIFL